MIDLRWCIMDWVSIIRLNNYIHAHSEALAHYKCLFEQAPLQQKLVWLTKATLELVAWWITTIGLQHLIKPGCHHFLP